MGATDKDVFDRCVEVLDRNKNDGYTVPSRELYPHQWLWDSCFTAIGLRHIDLNRAKRELRSLKRGAWENGMLPGIIFNDAFLNFDYVLWNSKLLPESPDLVNTTCITQPPMLAEAVVKVGELMPEQNRIRWYRSMFECIVDYHEWLYRERNPDNDGLIIQLHPYESGLDNTPPWVYALRKMRYPWWVKAVHIHSVKVILNHFRRDTRFVPVSQRTSLKDALQAFYVIRKLAKNRYKYVPNAKNQLVMQDLTFNSIFIRANKHLAAIARAINEPLSSELVASMNQTEASLEKLWSPEHNQYYSRNYSTKRLIKQSTVASFMPLYAGCIPKDRAKILANMLENPRSFGPAFPIPSVPLDSPKFRRTKYWQGPTWLNTNWLIIQGLRSYGFRSLANAISRSSVGLVVLGGAREYFSPTDGSAKGARDFSWTASLAIDLLKSN